MKVVAPREGVRELGVKEALGQSREPAREPRLPPAPACGVHRGRGSRPVAMSGEVVLLSQLVAFSESVSCILWLGQCSQAWHRTPLQWSTLSRMQRKHLRVGLCPVIVLSSTWAQELCLPFPSSLQLLLVHVQVLCESDPLGQWSGRFSIENPRALKLSENEQPSLLCQAGQE